MGTWGGAALSAGSEQVSCLQTGCDVDSEMKPFLGGSYPVLCFQSTPTFFNSCVNILLSQAFRASFFLEIVFLPALLLRTGFQKLEVDLGPVACFEGSLPSAALRIFHSELVYFNSKLPRSTGFSAPPETNRRALLVLCTPTQTCGPIYVSSTRRTQPFL